MKKFLLFLLLFPLYMYAQDNSAYLEGAVPLVDGKVIFQKKFSSDNRTKESTYKSIRDWMHKRFDIEGCRVVYENPENGEIAAIGDEYIEFSRSALALDRSKMQYQVTAECNENGCTIQFRNIRYEYDVAYQREPEKYNAEEWITDEYALHKGKLNRISGKFRRETINFANRLFADAGNALGNSPNNVSKTTERQTDVSVTTVPSGEFDGYKSFQVSQIPEIMKSMLSESPFSIECNGKIIIPAGKAEWKGIGTMFGKNIASFAISEEEAKGVSLKDNDVYKLSFSKSDGDKDAWIIFECRKSGASSESGQTVVIGEILNVWVK